MRKALQQYQAVNLDSSIEGASPYRITQLLIDGCLRFMRQARLAIDKKDYEQKSIFISKAQAIIAALAGSVDRESSPELSDNLIRLYDFSIEQMLAASVEMDATKLDSAIHVIGQIKAGWDAIPPEEIQKAELMRVAK